MKTVSREQVATAEQAGELALPPRVQEALGQLVGSAREGLLALSVGSGSACWQSFWKRKSSRWSA